MAHKDIENLQRLIANHQRRLQILKEQEALQGLSVDPKIPLEIEDIEEKIERLQLELEELKVQEVKGPGVKDDLKKIRIEVQISDITTPDPNTLLQVGCAWGKNRPTLLVAHNRAELTFGVDGQRCIFYDRIRDLEENLTRELRLLNL